MSPVAMDGHTGGVPRRSTGLAAPLIVSWVVGLVLAVVGRVTAAVVLVILVVVATHARAASPSFDRSLQGGIARFASAAAKAIGWVLLALVAVLVFFPVAAIAWLFEVIGRLRRDDPPAWIGRRADRPQARTLRTFGSEPRARASMRPRPLVRVFAAASVIVLLDVSIGALLAGTDLMWPADRGDLATTIERATLENIASPVFAAEPWANDLGRDMAAFELQDRRYEPYLVREIGPFTSEHINTTDEERLSYRQPGGGGSPYRVAFFGGSVMFGMGQRDDHTIPSAVARAAEADRIDLEVHNYGLPGWVSWQEFQYLERLLADGHDFDLVVFLDGFNEFEIQSTDFSEQPTHHSASAFEALIAEFSDERQSPPGFWSGLSELKDVYRRNSAIWRIVDRFGGREVSVSTAGSGSSPGRVAQQRAALDIYGRASRRIEGLAAEYGTEALRLWQPRQRGWSAEILKALPEGTIDATGVFDGREDELYYDHVHTNEAGARLLAEEIWTHVRPRLETQEQPP